MKERFSSWVEHRTRSTSRAGSAADRFAWDRLDAEIRRTWPVVIFTMAFAALFAVFIWWTFPGPDGLRGAIAGVIFTIPPFYLYHLLVLKSGASGSAMGADAERDTAAILSKLRGSGWKVLSHVFVRKKDIDHVAIGPDGVLVVETKWRSWSGAINEKTPGILRAVNSVRAQRDDVRRQVGLTGRRKDHVVGVVVIHGVAQEKFAQQVLEFEESDSVLVMSSSVFQDMLTDLGETRLTHEEIERCYKKLVDLQDLGEQWEADHSKDRRVTLIERAKDLLRGTQAWAIGFAIAALLLGIGSLGLLISVGLFCLSVVFRNVPVWNRYATGFAVGTLFVLVPVGALVLVSLVF